MRYFSDCHFHVMTLEQPNFASFFNSFYDSAGGLITANMTENYILTADKLKGDTFLRTLTNTLMAFDRPIGDTFTMMEDDLRGVFTSKEKDSYAPIEPYIHDGKLHIRGMEFDKMIMIPLVMDFSQDQKELDKLYYSFPAEDKITPYLHDTVEGMNAYYRKNPDGLFEFYPFAGIDPRLHSMRFLEDFLDKYINTSHRMHKPHTIPSKPFYGIKFLFVTATCNKIWSHAATETLLGPLERCKNMDPLIVWASIFLRRAFLFVGVCRIRKKYRVRQVLVMEMFERLLSLKIDWMTTVITGCYLGLFSRRRPPIQLPIAETKNIDNCIAMEAEKMAKTFVSMKNYLRAAKIEKEDHLPPLIMPKKSKTPRERKVTVPKVNKNMPKKALKTPFQFNRPKLTRAMSAKG